MISRGNFSELTNLVKKVSPLVVCSVNFNFEVEMLRVLNSEKGKQCVHESP